MATCEFFFTPSGTEYVREGNGWKRRKAGHFLARVWDERANCYRYGCQTCAHQGKCPLEEIHSANGVDDKLEAGMKIAEENPEMAGAVFLALLPFMLGSLLCRKKHEWPVPGHGAIYFPDLRAKERLAQALPPMLKLTAAKLVEKAPDLFPAESVAQQWGLFCLWSLVVAQWQNAEIQPDIRVGRKLEVGWHVRAPDEFVAAICEGVLMVFHNTRRLGICKNCGGIFWPEKAKKQLERICPECRQVSEKRHKESDRRRKQNGKRPITPESRFFNLVNQNKRRGTLSPEQAARLKKICRIQGVDAAREEYRRLKEAGRARS